MIENIPVLIINIEVNQIQANNNIIIDMTGRFENDYRCPL